MVFRDPFEFLSSNKIGQVSIPVKGDKVLRLECITQVLAPPFLEVGVPAGRLAVDSIDMTGECIVHFDASSEIICYLACIDRVVGDNRLVLSCFKTVTQDQKRKYFRVETGIPVDLQHVHGQGTVVMAGESVNISGSGILVAFNGPVAGDTGIWLEIELPEPHNRDIRCIGHVVRTSREEEGTYLVAFHFDRIKPQDQEDLVSFCFDQQRRQLRLKVKIMAKA